MDFFDLILLGFTGLLESIGLCLLPNLKMFQSLLFSAPHSFSSSAGAPIIWIFLSQRFLKSCLGYFILQVISLNLPCMLLDARNQIYWIRTYGGLSQAMGGKKYLCVFWVISMPLVRIKPDAVTQLFSGTQIWQPCIVWCLKRILKEKDCKLGNYLTPLVQGILRAEGASVVGIQWYI